MSRHIIHLYSHFINFLSLSMLLFIFMYPTIPIHFNYTATGNGCPGTSSTCTGNYTATGTRAVDVHVHSFSHIPFGGDQLTIARIRSSQRIQFNLENGDERLEGFIPVIEDWHTKMCFMEVNIYRVYGDRCHASQSIDM